jgi:predicted RNA binding protein with dsRBD fold (UPF0201 family)
MTGDTADAATKQKEDEEGGKVKSEGQSSECISHSMARLLHYRKIETAVRRSLNSSQKQLTITQYFSKQALVVYKNVKYCEYTKENNLDYLCFWITHASVSLH